jgi:hypothetical protein
MGVEMATTTLRAQTALARKQKDENNAVAPR